MYGKRRYGRLNKDVPVTPAAVPTFICSHCHKVKSTASPFVEITAMEKNQLFLYTKICGDCAKLLQDWMKK